MQASPIQVQVQVYAPGERADSLFLFLLYSFMYSVDMKSRSAMENTASALAMFSLPIAPRHFLAT